MYKVSKTGKIQPESNSVSCSIYMEVILHKSYMQKKRNLKITKTNGTTTSRRKKLKDMDISSVSIEQGVFNAKKQR